MSDTATKNINALHVAFGVDENYLHPMGVTITSIIENNLALDLVFHVFISAISSVSRARVEQLEGLFSKPVHLHIVDELVDVKDPGAGKGQAYISKAAYLRLLIPEALKDVSDRVLYLDADILCVGDISGLLRLDIGDTIAAVIRDAGSESKRVGLIRKGQVLTDYFNSGVLYINIPRWITERVSERALEKIADPALNLRYSDQDALNIVLDGKVQFIDRVWNHQYGLTGKLRKGKIGMDVPPSTKFVHFIGPMKPWRSWNPHQSKELFLKYQALSPWAGECLGDGFTPREIYVYSRFMYRLMFQQGRWLRGLIWYGRFLHKKYMVGY
ncbi:glycosyltransferase family 8 protein [Azotobacter chroococcum]|jgi:lipopolysaccharide biosynthesis glycosyltransferase|uniref:UDP-glucose:(Glucosyl)LPS alpha-1, 3-glucosyltransferase/UDP-D-galactose:(Glucosyl)LPS alpha-1,3-D-galactosyltransferase n=1 Tax=Azotobacter chroococcum TaxID=353 RepID=A0A4R1PVZ5_9GAMM|nr:glycosyltransferase [Azotobacter chroococcum]TBW00261.1 lipopolysaccharide 1,3-galactosyltransferase [Azotobacter chroococcum]TCL31863.1 UDP-glucose:(glucosyl)LPS alpha-1,3-glucosyltransferase/UDP-D-galactose:(glucosyl)LPS alpha-1,3-D-galactosyltransferase [Azotobacter chroococcum]